MTKKFMARIAFLFAVSTMVSACAPLLSGTMNASIDDKAVLEKTAKYFSVPSDSITIIGVEKSMLSTSYVAKLQGKTYNCTIYYNNVKCELPGGVAVNNDQPARNDISMSSVQVQTRLNELGFSVGTPDGIFGKKSVEQLKLFQRSKGLPASGKIDTRTIEALR